MIQKFAAVPGFRVALAAMFFVTILAGATTLRAQQTPAQAAPAQPQPSSQPSTGQSPSGQPGSQEASPEDIPGHRVKPKQFKNWNFNVGGGASLTNGTTTKYAKSGGGIAAAGAARNYSPFFGFRLDVQYDNLPLRTSALQLAQAPGATSQVYSVMLDPIIYIPASKVWSGYLVFGPSYFHRSGKLDSSTAVPGSACNGFWSWWGTCYNGSVPLNRGFLSTHQNEIGENFGGGIARKIRPNLEIYGEFRYLHGSGNNITTDLRPITVGVRW